VVKTVVRICCIGDVIGRPGRDAVRDLLPPLVRTYGVDVVVANGENIAGGVGITPDTARDLLRAGVDVITTGNHVWKHREIVPFLDQEERIIRPLNLPAGTPGRGVAIHHRDGQPAVGVINLIGRVFMEPYDNPFHAVGGAIDAVRREATVVIVDMHAEATSEKRAMGHFLDGRASIVFGTHTHVPTADEEILAGGTAYVTDVGMTGPYDSVIGTRKENIIEKFLTNRPVAYVVAVEGIQLRAILVEVDAESGRATSIERVVRRPS
jgi:metallophosphoesterase (TIGR00282 family)